MKAFTTMKLRGVCTSQLPAQYGSCNARGERGGEAASQRRPCRNKLDELVGWLKTRVEAEPDITMPELAEVLKPEHALTATLAMLSQHLNHRFGFTYKKIPDCDGAPAQTGEHSQVRVAAPLDAEDAP